MRILKYIFLIITIAFVATGCTKFKGVKPSGDTTKKFDTDAFIHHISFDAPVQFVQTSVADTKLTMIYYENVSIYIPKDGFTLSFAVHLDEDFSGSLLNNYHFTTINAAGDINTDYVDDNLNNVTAKTIKDTVISGINMKKITVQRPFTFTKVYNDAQSAIDGQNSVLQAKKDTIKFSSYIYFTKTYPVTGVSANVLYVK